MQKKTAFPINVYSLTPATNFSAGLIFDSPHSGQNYPADFNFSCDLNLLKCAEDQFIDELFEDAVVNAGGAFLKALFPRTYVDVNRAADDILPETLIEVEGAPLNPTARAMAGHGVFHMKIRGDMPVYDRLLTGAEIKNRLMTYYAPYHAALKGLLEDAHRRTPQIYHINCHSMTSANFKNYFAKDYPDFVLGDLDGTSCEIDFRNTVKGFLEGLGYRVVVNTPYRGAEILRLYGQPSLGRNSLQIEINKAIYLDEQTYEKSNDFNKIKDDLYKLVYFMKNYAEAQDLPLAAD